MRVLIANKDYELVVLFQRLIVHFFPEAEFIFARNSQSAVDLIKRFRFDVIVTELFFTSALYWAQFGVSIENTVPEGIGVIKVAKEKGVAVILATSILCSPSAVLRESNITLGMLAYKSGASCVFSDYNIFPKGKPYFLGEMARALFLKGRGCVHENNQKSV